MQRRNSQLNLKNLLLSNRIPHRACTRCYHRLSGRVQKFSGLSLKLYGKIQKNRTKKSDLFNKHSCAKAINLFGSSVVNNPSVSRQTTSRTSTVSPSRDFCEVVRLLKMKPSLYQDDLNIEPAILWIDTPYKADFWCFSRILPRPTS